MFLQIKRPVALKQNRSAIKLKCCCIMKTLYWLFAPIYHRRRYRKLFILSLLVCFFFLIATIARRSSNPKASSTIQSADVSLSKSGLNVHIWRDLCPASVQDLCDYPLFYTAPSERTVTTTLHIHKVKSNYGQRIFGFLHPPKTGKYKFAIASDDSSELWLSPNEDSSSAVRICNVGERNETYIWTKIGEFKRFSSQISDDIELEVDRKYYIEILHVQAQGYDFVQVAWNKPGASEFERIDVKNVSMFSEDTEFNPDFDKVPATVACARTSLRSQSIEGDSPPRYLHHEVVKDVLPYCQYKPSYLNKREKPWPVNMYSFLYDHLFPVKSYPSTEYEKVSAGEPGFGEHTLEAKTADTVVALYKERLHQKNPAEFEVLSLVNVERKRDEEFGSRFLLELKVKVTGETEPLMISEYVFMSKDSSSLCYPEGLQWNRKARIALVITLKNQGRWMVDFLNNLEEMYVATQDQDVSLVIFNYNSSGINLEKELEKRKLPHYNVFNYQAQHYSRTRSFNQAVKQVDDPHTIIFTLDQHLKLPNSFFDDIRKHCFEGLSVYTPLITRLSCGGLPATPKGHWDSQSFGLISIFKSDWDRVGGLDEEDYDDGVRGENWDLMEKIVRSGMEYERVRHPRMFYYYYYHA